MVNAASGSAKVLSDGEALWEALDKKYSRLTSVIYCFYKVLDIQYNNLCLIVAPIPKTLQC